MTRKATKFVLLSIALAVALGGLAGQQVAAHDMDAHAWTTGNMPASKKIYWLHGRVNDASEQNGLVNITHDPVKELAWPAMTMTFHVSDKTLFARMHPHDSIDFALQEVSGNHYEVVDVKEHN